METPALKTCKVEEDLRPWPGKTLQILFLAQFLAWLGVSELICALIYHEKLKAKVSTSCWHIILPVNMVRWGKRELSSQDDKWQGDKWVHTSWRWNIFEVILITRHWQPLTYRQTMLKWEGPKGAPLAGCDNFGVCFVLPVGPHYNPQHSLEANTLPVVVCFLLPSLSPSFASGWFGSPLRWHSLHHPNTQSPIAHQIHKPPHHIRHTDSATRSGMTLSDTQTQ